MRIGIDLDDTICSTEEIVHDRLEKYSVDENLDPLDIMNDEDLKANFFSIYAEDIYKNAKIKEEAKEVINRLKDKGNEIYIITSRDNNLKSIASSAYEITKEWLDKHGIKVDKILTAVYTESRADILKENKIDLMIDNEPYNYKLITSNNIKCILFDDCEKYALKENYITNWLDVEKYIEGSN